MSIFSGLFNGGNEEENVSKINWIILKDLNQLDEIAATSMQKPVIIFKHSTRCSVSRMALKQFEKAYSIADDSATPYFLDLILHRSVSNEIATRFNVQHQSPQILLIKNGKSVFNTSHSDIDADVLKQKL